MAVNRRPNRYNAARDKSDEAARLSRWQNQPKPTWSFTVEQVVKIAASVVLVAFIISLF